jgi:hypothetical protein
MTVSLCAFQCLIAERAAYLDECAASSPTACHLEQISHAAIGNQSAMVFHVVDKSALRRLAARLAEAERACRGQRAKERGRLELLFGDARFSAKRLTLMVRQAKSRQWKLQAAPRLALVPTGVNLDPWLAECAAISWHRSGLWN